NLSLAASSAAQQAQNGEEHVEQIEIDLQSRHDVIFGSVNITQAPCIEYEQAAEHENSSTCKPEICCRVAKEHVQQRRGDQYEESNDEETSPGGEITPADKGVEGEYPKAPMVIVAACVTSSVPPPEYMAIAGPMSAPIANEKSSTSAMFSGNRLRAPWAAKSGTNTAAIDNHGWA